MTSTCAVENWEISATDDAEPQPPEGRATLRKILTEPERQRRILIPGVLRDGDNTIVLAGEDVDTDVLACIFARAATSGLSLLPGERPESVPTFLAFPCGNWPRTRELLEFMAKSCGPHRLRMEEGLIINHRHRDGSEAIHLFTDTGRNRFKRCMQPGCKLAIITDVDRYLSSTSDKKPDYAAYHDFLRERNASGVATISFFGNDKGTRKALAAAGLLDGRYPIIEVADGGPPHEFGAAFDITRTRFAEIEHLPRRFLLWYTTLDGRFDCGWQLRDADDPTPKELAMRERQLRVLEMHLLGFEGKKIAEAIHADPATVSRDLARIKTWSKQRWAWEHEEGDAEAKPRPRPLQNCKNAPRPRPAAGQPAKRTGSYWSLAADGEMPDGQ